MNGWPILPDGTASRRLVRAETLNADQSRIEILSEVVFLERIGKCPPAAKRRTTHSAEVMRRMIGVSAESLRRWEQLGLIRSDDALFDYQDLVSLRTIAELIDQGVRPETINKTLRRLESVMPDVRRPLSQVSFIAQNPRTLLAEFDDICMSPDGQMIFDFAGMSVADGPLLSLAATDWDSDGVDAMLAYGQACEELERYEEAADAYREVIASTSRCPEAFFHLANVLRALGRIDAAEEHYRTAVACDPNMAEAWHNLADLQEEQGRIEEAVDSLKSALRANHDYADAYCNLAICCEKLERTSEAADHWRAYLRLDDGGEWADEARGRLKRLDEMLSLD